MYYIVNCDSQYNQKFGSRDSGVSVMLTIKRLNEFNTTFISNFNTIKVLCFNKKEYLLIFYHIFIKTLVRFHFIRLNLLKLKRFNIFTC